MRFKRAAVPALMAALTLVLGGCVGFVIDQASDAAIAVAKIPVKVGGAVIDGVTRGGEKK